MTDRITPTPDALAEALAAHALDILPPEAQAQMHAALAANPDSQQLLDDYRAVVGMLAYTAQNPVPPPAARDAVLRAARSKRPPQRARNAFTFQYAPLIAACLIVLALLGDIGVRISRAPMSATTVQAFTTLLSAPGLTSFDMLPEAAAPNAIGRIYLTPDHTRSGIAVSGLPPLPRGQVYQLWLRLGDQTRVSAGTFTVDSSGVATLALVTPHPGLPYVSCGITQEPEGGSAMPTGPRILASGPWTA